MQLGPDRIARSIHRECLPERTSYPVTVEIVVIDANVQSFGRP